MPTGLSDSPIPDNIPVAHAAARQPEINDSFPLQFPGSGVLNLPGYAVSSRATVRIRSRKTNTHEVITALNRDYLSEEFGDPISPDVEIIYPVSNLAEIWAKGEPGEWIVVSVRANPVG